MLHTHIVSVIYTRSSGGYTVRPYSPVHATKYTLHATTTRYMLHSTHYTLHDKPHTEYTSHISPNTAQCTLVTHTIYTALNTPHSTHLHTTHHTHHLYRSLRYTYNIHIYCIGFFPQCNTTGLGDDVDLLVLGGFYGQGIGRKGGLCCVVCDYVCCVLFCVVCVVRVVCCV